MAELDLDAKRAARAEADGSGHVVRFHGQEFPLPPEAPYDFAEALTYNRVREAVAELLGERAADFWALKPSVPDIQAFIEGMEDVYAVSKGESRASSGSSSDTSSHSRPTSSSSSAAT